MCVYRMVEGGAGLLTGGNALQKVVKFQLSQTPPPPRPNSLIHPRQVHHPQPPPHTLTILSHLTIAVSSLKL